LSPRIAYLGREGAKAGGHCAGPKQTIPVNPAVPMFTPHKAAGLKSGACEEEPGHKTD